MPMRQPRLVGVLCNYVKNVPNKGRDGDSERHQEKQTVNDDAQTDGESQQQGCRWSIENKRLHNRASSI
jgi:hypothetical protein